MPKDRAVLGIADTTEGHVVTTKVFAVLGIAESADGNETDGPPGTAPALREAKIPVIAPNILISPGAWKQNA